MGYIRKVFWILLKVKGSPLLIELFWLCRYCHFWEPCYVSMVQMDPQDWSDGWIILVLPSNDLHK